MNIHYNIVRNLRFIVQQGWKMAAKGPMEKIKENADLTKQMISTLKSEMIILNNEYNSIRAKQLKEENARLLEAVEIAKNRLIQVENSNGTKQIPLPNTPATTVSCAATPTEKEVVVTKPDVKAEAKPKKEKKAKEPKEKAPAPEEAPIDVGRLDLRVGKVEDVQRHPDADSLYLLKINCGEDKPRTVCSGLVKFVPMDDLKDRSVVLLCNLKPVKMRGVTSEAMVMCASTPEKVEVLSPPTGCMPGELVQCEGYSRQPDAVMNPKKKIFETVAPDLHTNDALLACYKGVPFNVPGKGNIVSFSLKNVAVK